MYSRINYVDIKLDHFTQIDQVWGTTVAAYAGLVKGYFLRLGDTSHTLSVVLFDNEQTMIENTKNQLAAAAQAVADYRLTEPDVHLMEVCAEVQGKAGGAPGYARVADVTMKVDRLDEVIAGWPGHVSSYRDDAGFCAAYLCCNRSTGNCRSISLWATSTDTQANEASGAFKATVEPYADMIAVAPTLSYWDVRIVV